MERVVFTGLLCLALLAAVVACQPQAPAETEEGPAAQEGPSIAGTYRLVSRELPDGSIRAYPDIFGLITWTEGYRNFNIYWTDAAGNRTSISYAATYELTEDQYSEQSLYRLLNDEIGGEGLSYDLSGPAGSSPVTVEDGTISFDLPLYDEPWITFEGDQLTASREGEFVDNWEKVD